MFEGGTNAYSNWIDLGVGGFFTSGNKAQFQHQHQTSGGLFGGIEDFHYQGNVAKDTTLSIDGHALFDNEDYSLHLGLVKEKVGYLRFSYDEFRTWYNGDGGFFPPSDTFYPLSGDALELDRGQIIFEGGLTLDNAPKITFRYTHTFREGEKDSSIWGPAHPEGGTLLRGISPSFYDINEHSDSFQLDASHHIKATDLGLGFSYEAGKLDDALNISEFPGEVIQQRITDRQGTSYDLFSVHGYSETWIKKNLLLSSGLSYSDLDNNFTGSRIYGSDFDVGYIPSAQNGFGYYNLIGSSRMHEYVMDLNLMYKPTEHLSIVPSVRAQKEDINADSSGLETLGDNPSTPFSANNDEGVLDVRERLDLNYNAIANWAFYARGELTEGNGNLDEYGGLVPINGIGILPVQEQMDNHRFFQKYSLGARWYPQRGVVLDAGAYYKLDRYDYNFPLDSTANDSFTRYPAYLVLQDFETYDGNVRLTLRPWQNITLVSRYEYQLSTVHTAPDPVAGLPDVESSRMVSHIIAQDVSWAPWSRLYLQAGLNYVLSSTKTPGSEVIQGILESENNYWTLNFSTGLTIDDKTDLKVSYFYYLADNYQNDSLIGMPFGVGGQEHAVTATLTRRIRKNISVSLRYGFFSYTDTTSGGNNNFDAHMIYSSIRYRF